MDSVVICSLTRSSVLSIFPLATAFFFLSCCTIKYNFTMSSLLSYSGTMMEKHDNGKDVSSGGVSNVACCFADIIQDRFS